MSFPARTVNERVRIKRTMCRLMHYVAHTAAERLDRVRRITIVSGARFVCVVGVVGAVGVVGVVGDEPPPQATRVMQRVDARKSSF